MDNDKINIAELLKDCPSGMELDCPLYDTSEYNVTFIGISEGDYFPIKIETPDGIMTLTKYGCFSNNKKSECIIFPKGKTTWEGFVPPREFKDGDVLVHTQNERFIMSIYKSNENEKLINTHVIFWDREEGLSVGMQICCYADNVRFATKEEKAKLFDAIKDNGYKWNEETKTLEKLPKFKVGDKIVKKGDISVTILISKVDDECYYSTTEGSIGLLPIAEQDDWELVPNKFDATTLKPFDKVLVRDDVGHRWRAGFYRVGCASNYTIPYEGNEHLLGTTNDCDERFKTW